MSGIFPQGVDGGLPPNPADLLNPSHAYDPTVDPLNTAALYYGNGCDVRLRPEVVNSLISEIEALVDRGEVAYDSSKLTNLEVAARYLIQRGIPRSAHMVGGPASYNVTLDPPATRYNDLMTLSLIPEADNNGAVSVNVNGLGFVPLLRNDGKPLQAKDLIQGYPLEAIYWDGEFYVVGPVNSQLGGGAFDWIILIFDNSTVWSVPDGVGHIALELWGAGGGGAAGNGTYGGGGGGGGQYGMGYYATPAGTKLNIVIGQGGLGNQAGNNRGFAGGTSSVSIVGGSNLMFCVGGGGGNLVGEYGSTPGQGGSGGMEMIDGSGGFPMQTFWGSGTPGGGTARGRLYAMQGNHGLPPGGGGSGNQMDNFYTAAQIGGANGRCKITYART